MEKFNYLPELPEPTTINIDHISIQLFIVENDLWLFDNRQLAENYGTTENNVRRHLQRNKDITLIESIHWFKKQGWLPPNFPSYTLWTKEGFIQFGNFIKNSQADKLLTALGVKSRQFTSIESNIIEIIKDTFQGITPVKLQHWVSGYKVDIFLPDLNIIMEIDEMNHESYNSDEELLREFRIKDSLKCEIIRYNPNNPDNNIGQPINSILKKLMKP